MQHLRGSEEKKNGKERVRKEVKGQRETGRGEEKGGERKRHVRKKEVTRWWETVERSVCVTAAKTVVIVNVYPSNVKAINVSLAATATTTQQQ